MRWAINLGNTSIQLGRQQSGRTVEVGKCPASRWRELLEIVPSSDSIWMASVNPAVEAAIAAERAVRTLAWSPHLGIEVAYSDPSRIGADRLANALALQENGALPAVSVDCGTATTLEVVDASGRFQGGAILPGFGLMARSLDAGTAMLPDVEVPEGLVSAIGNDTRTAIQAGTFYGQAGAVERLLDEVERELGSRVRVVVCGGAGPRLAAAMRRKTEQAPELTLRGLFVAASRLEPGV
jgi:type III pantothenate kinase